MLRTYAVTCKNKLGVVTISGLTQDTRTAQVIDACISAINTQAGMEIICDCRGHDGTTIQPASMGVNVLTPTIVKTPRP